MDAEKPEDYPNLLEFVDSSLKKFKFFFGTSLQDIVAKIDNQLSDYQDKLLDKVELSDHATHLEVTEKLIDQIQLHKVDQLIVNDKIEGEIKLLQQKSDSFATGKQLEEACSIIHKCIKDCLDEIQTVHSSFNIEIERLGKVLDDKIKQVDLNHQEKIKQFMTLKSDTDLSLVSINEKSDQCVELCKKVNNQIFVQEKKIEHFYIILERAGLYIKPGSET